MSSYDQYFFGTQKYRLQAFQNRAGKYFTTSQSICTTSNASAKTVIKLIFLALGAIQGQKGRFLTDFFDFFNEFESDRKTFLRVKQDPQSGP